LVIRLPAHGRIVKAFLTALFMATAIHLATFGLLVWACMLSAGGSSPPFLLLAYGDSSVAGMDVDVVSVDPGTERYSTRLQPGGAEPAPSAPETTAAPQPLVLPPETAAQVKALPVEEAQPQPVEAPAPTSTLAPAPTPPATEPPPVQAALTAAISQASVARPSTSSSPGGAPLQKGTPSRGGTVGSCTGVRMIGLPRPVYPREAVLRGLEGRVVLFLRVSAEGRVTDVKVQESSGHPLLDGAALEFGRTLQFVPAREDQQAVSATALYPVRYQLTENR
jgi:protein TonB